MLTKLSLEDEDFTDEEFRASANGRKASISFVLGGFTCRK